ncbi:uncharacterized protein LOC144599806 isoform X2 [Rhinoraja longicauda]
MLLGEANLKVSTCQQNGKVDTKERNDNPRTEDCLSSRNSNQETSSMRAQSSIPRDNETDFKDKEVNTSDSEMDLHPAYKITLQTAGQKMTTANVLPATAAMTSEKGASPLITEKVPSDVMPKTWYTSMIKDDHSIPKADDDGWPSYTDAKREPNVTNQSFPSSAAVLTSRLTEPLPYNSTTKDKCALKQPFLSDPQCNSDYEKQNTQSLCLQPKSSDAQRDQNGSNPLSANSLVSTGWNCQNYAPSSHCQYTMSMEILASSLTHVSTTANPEENDWALHKGNIDTSSGHAEAGNVCAFEDRWSSVSHHSCQFQKPTRNATLVDSVLHRTGSVPAVKASTSHLAIQDPVPRSHTSPGTDTDPCSEIRRDSTKLISVDIENDANLNRPTQKQKPQEEISDPKQQLNMEWITRAKYDFHGQTSKELAVKKGDSVFIHRQRDDNWYVAECNGNRGLLPVCYVEPPSEFQPHDNTMDEIAIAKFRFVALTNIELPLEKNQLVVLLRRIDENWYEGKVPGTDHKGIFPVAYVEVIGKPAGDYICHRDHTPTPASHLNLEVASQRSFHQLHQRRMNYDNVQLGGEIYLALYSFVPHKHDELELRQGDRIKVIKKCDDGWYLGTSIRTKKFGTFPGNYVRKFESV